MNTKQKIATALLALMLAPMFLYGGYLFAFPQGDTEYRYEVKAQQVNENEMVNESIEYDELSEEEREVLFRAFKKSDHFLGGAEVTVTTDEPLENVDTNEWKVVRVEGVPILVAINGPDEVRDDTPMFNGIILLVTTMFVWMVGGAIIEDLGKTDRNRARPKDL